MLIKPPQNCHPPFGRRTHASTTWVSCRIAVAALRRGDTIKKKITLVLIESMLIEEVRTK